MQISGLPTRISVPFANSGTKNTIPVNSQIGITAGAASFTDGFPPLTMTSVSAGGVPPYGADFNGILNAITVAIRWNAAGSGYPFDSGFASSVAGYPEGALLPCSDYSGYWLNTVDANSTAPENSTSETTGWVPGINYGVTAITGLSGSSVTLTTLQASKSRITLAGTLTANINLIFPAWTFSWTLVNNCAGDFSVTCTTASGAGVTVPTGLTAVLVGDGTNITQDTDVLGPPGRLLNVQTFSASGTYTPTSGTKKIRVKAWGAGGGGGGMTSAGTSAAGAAGGYAEGLIDIEDVSTVAVTIGQGGASVAANSSAKGGDGGSTIFGALISCTGGKGGVSGGANPSGGIPTGGNILNITGQGGQGGSYVSGILNNGSGGAPYGGYNAFPHVSSAGDAGSFPGGGGAMGAYVSSSTNYGSGAGANGLVIIEEYS